MSNCLTLVHLEPSFVDMFSLVKQGKQFPMHVFCCHTMWGRHLKPRQFMYLLTLSRTEAKSTYLLSQKIYNHLVLALLLSSLSQNRHWMREHYDFPYPTDDYMKVMAEHCGETPDKVSEKITIMRLSLEYICFSKQFLWYHEYFHMHCFEYKHLFNFL